MVACRGELPADPPPPPAAAAAAAPPLLPAAAAWLTDWAASCSSFTHMGRALSARSR